MRRPVSDEYELFYEGYVNLTRGSDLLQNLQDSGDSLLRTLETMPPEKADFAYAEGKWTVKQMLRHILDTDTVFLYRALHFARAGEAELPGFDENAWARKARVDHQSLKTLTEDFRLLRNLTINTYRSFDEATLDQRGKANGGSFSVLAMGFITAGHTFHHIHILKERYL